MDLNLSEAYINELLIITKGDWSDHLEKLEITLQKLKYNRLECNVERSFFLQTEMEYLGLWFTRTGIRPINKKVESILNMKPPKNTKEFSVFIGIVKYFRDMWDNWSHLLNLLTTLTSHEVKFRDPPSPGFQKNTSWYKVS